MKKKLIALIVLFVAAGAMIYSGSQFIETEQAYQESSETYRDIAHRVKKETVVKPVVTMVDKTGFSGYEINFDALREINGDAETWLYSPDTAIDYPVMKADDYNYYLYHLPDGEQNANGSLFIDYNCAPDFNDPMTVIYGHNMKSGSMFGSLKGYKEQAYYDEHPVMYLYTPQENFRIELLYGCVIGAGLWRERAFMYKENVGALIAYAAHYTTFISDAEYTEGDRVVALSTCTYEFEDARYVVIGVLKPYQTESEGR